MRQVSKCCNKVEEAQNKGLGLAVREYRVWLLVGRRTQQKCGGRGKGGTGTEGSREEN